MIYGMQMSISKECGIPMVLMGTVTGIVSTIGYSIDLWLYAVTGSFLDTMGNADINTYLPHYSILHNRTHIRILCKKKVGCKPKAGGIK